MIYSPIGVFALLAGVLVQVSEGDIGFAFQILTGLGIYSLTVIIGLSIMIFIIYPKTHNSKIILVFIMA